MISRKNIPKELHGQVRQYDGKVNGIGSGRLTGLLNTEIKLGNIWLANVRIFIVESDIPMLIGRDVIFERSDYKCLPDTDGLRVINKTLKKEEQHIQYVQRSAFIGNKSDQRLFSKLKEEKMIDLEKISTIDAEQRMELALLINEFKEIFCIDGDPVGTFKEYGRIPTQPGKTAARRQHPIPAQFNDAVDKEILVMRKDGIIEDCSDSRGFNSPILCVKKKNGKVRICCNYKSTLNTILQEVDREVWTLPKIENIFSGIGTSVKYFTTLDVSRGYWHCQIHPDDRHKTAFKWKGRCYMFCRMPFGLFHSGDVFCKSLQVALNKVERSENVISYVDDVLVFDISFEDHMETLRQVLTALGQSGVRLGASKCQFFTQTTTFMGRHISPDGISPDPKNIEAILNLNPPTNRKELLSCLGMLGWVSSWISSKISENVAQYCFSNVTRELNKLTKKATSKSFTWTDQANEAFIEAKKRLAEPKVLAYPDFALPFILTTDASDFCAGAALLQKQKEVIRMIGASSLTFSDTQQRWSTVEKEGFALLAGMERFKYYLEGSKPFVVLTDHKPLLNIDKKLSKNRKLQRWRERMSIFNFVVQYIPGSKNVVADYLSRPFGKIDKPVMENNDPAGQFYKVKNENLEIYVPSWACGGVFPKEILLSKVSEAQECLLVSGLVSNSSDLHLHELVVITRAQEEDITLREVRENIRNDVKPDKWSLSSFGERDIFLRYRKQFKFEDNSDVLLINQNERDRIVIPYSLRVRYLKQAHEKAHFGTKKTLELLSWAWWPGMYEDITDYCASCVTCLKVKGSDTQPNKLELLNLPRGSVPFEIIMIDYIEFERSKSGKKYAMTLQCQFTRFVQVYPCAKHDAMATARHLMSFISTFGFPRVLSSDRGRHFTAELVQNLCKMLNVKQLLHVPYRPEASGSIERLHRTLKSGIWAVAYDQGSDWEDVIAPVVFAINTVKNRATKCTPFEAVFGRAAAPLNITVPSSKPDQQNPETYAHQCAETLRRSTNIIKIAQTEADERQKRANPSTRVPEEIHEGEFVFLKRPVSAQAKREHTQMIGPYRVTASDGHVLCIDDNQQNKWVHRQHIVLAKRRRPDLSEEIDMFGSSDEEVAPISEIVGSAILQIKRR